MARGIKTEGFAELVNDLATMAETLSDDQGAAQFRKTATGILNDAAEPMLAAMQRYAPVKGGTLRRALKKGKVLTRKSGGGYTIKVGSQKGDDAYYAGWVEFGHGADTDGLRGPAAPHPFMRPAYDATKEQAYGIIRDRLNEEIGKIGGQ